MAEKDPAQRAVSLDELTEAAAIFRPYPGGGFQVRMSRLQWAELGQPLRLRVQLIVPDA